jgi:hypothetical protein
VIASFIFIYGIYYMLSYLLSKILYNTLNLTRISLQGFSFLFITMMFFNAVFFYDSPDIVDWVLGIPFILYSMIKIYRLLRGLDRCRLDYVKAVLPPIILTFADPRFTIWFFMIIIFLLIPTMFRKVEFRKMLRVFAYFFVIGLPVYLYTYLVLTAGAFMTVYTSARPLTLSGVSSFSGAYPLFMYFAFHGEYWPSIWVSPVAYLSGNINSLQAFGYPTGLVLGNGLLAYAWLSFSFIPFVLSFIPIIFRERYILYLYPGYIIFFLVSIGGYAPIWFVDLYLVLGRLPIMGGIFGITFAITTYFMQITIVYALFLCTIIFGRLLSDGPFVKISVSYKNAYRSLKHLIFSKKFVTVIIILAFVLPNYQIIDGSKYPSNWTPVIGGNGVPSIGTVTTINPPSYWVREYNEIEDQENGSFYVGYSYPAGFAYKWDDSVSGVIQPGIPAPQGFYQNLSTIMLLNETYLTETLMTIFGVKFFIVDNTTIVSNRQYETFFSESPGLQLYYEHSPDLWIYEDLNASIFKTGVPLNYSGTDSLFYSHLLSELSGGNPVLVNSCTASMPNLSINSSSLNEGVLAITGKNISTSHTVVNFGGYSKFQWNSGGGPSFYIGGPWIIADYSTENTLSLYENGSTVIMEKISGKSSPELTVQLNGRNSMIDVPSPELSTVIKGHINIKNASRSSFFVTGYNFMGSSIFSKEMPIENNVNFSILLPNGISYLNIGFDITFEKNVTLSGMGITYKFTNQTSSYEKYVSSVPVYTNNITTPNLSIDQYFPGSATNYNLGENWTGTSFTTGALVNETPQLLNMTTVNGNGEPDGGLLVLSYKAIDLPGASLVRIPDYESTSVLTKITLEYRFLENNFTSMGIGVGASNYSASFNIPYSSVWRNVSETFLIPAGSSQFNIQIGAVFNGSLLIKKLSGFYEFVREINVTASFSKKVTMKSGNYTLSTFGSGKGLIIIGVKEIPINTTFERLYSKNFKVPIGGEINISTRGNLSISGVMIRPQKLTFAEGITSDFYINDFTGTGTVYVTGYKFLIFPYRINMNGATLLGKESSGFYVYALSKIGNVTFYFPDYFLLNLSTVIIMIAIYCLLIFVYFPRSKVRCTIQ